MKQVRCYNPECGFVMTVKNYTPKACPVCGYTESEKDRQRYLDQVEYAKKKDESFKFENISNWMKEDI